jgi:hypothetical protein
MRPSWPSPATVKEDRHRSREAGFDAHLVKPIDPKDLHRILGGLEQLSSPKR